MALKKFNQNFVAERTKKARNKIIVDLVGRCKLSMEHLKGPQRFCKTY